MIGLRTGLALASCLAVLHVQGFAQDSEALFHHAYFLENERGHDEEALALYQRVARSADADAGLKAEAARRAAALEEDLASADLARLVPAGTIFYAELREPGRALSSALAGLGLLGSAEDAARSGALVVSPELVRGLSGIRGAALAITRLPEGDRPPGGVLVLHAGDVAFLRGLIETAISARGTAEEPIAGCPTFRMAEEVHVSFGQRVIVASGERGEIEGVLRRLQGRADDGLASSPAMRELLAQRENDVFFCALNAVPVRPHLAELLGRQGGLGPQAAWLGPVLDVQSLRACAARAAVGSQGIVLDADLFLEQDHRNLVFNLLRSAPLDPATLDLVPEGAAAFLAGSLNERGPAIAPLDVNPDGQPVVRAMDFGRELFANVAGLALFVLPGQGLLPEAALVLSSNDPERSTALLGLLLGLGNMVATGQSLAPEEDEVAGCPAQVFRVPPGIPLYLVTHEKTLILSPSVGLIETSIAARARGSTILHDASFAPALGRLHEDTTLAFFAHLGRALAVVRPYLAPEQRAELERLAPALERTVLALHAEHSAAHLGVSLALHGIPNVAGLVSEFLSRQRGEALGRKTSDGQRGAPRAAAAGVGELDAQSIRQRFDQLALQRQEAEAARAFLRQNLASLADDARALNNLAWSLLTEEQYAGRFDDLALEAALAADRASGHAVWQYLDTLALARFRTGSAREAIAIAEQALQRVGETPERADVEAALRRYRSAQDGAVASDTPR